jgi:hypothetical protein
MGEGMSEVDERAVTLPVPVRAGSFNAAAGGSPYAVPIPSGYAQGSLVQVCVTTIANVQSTSVADSNGNSFVKVAEIQWNAAGNWSYTAIWELNNAPALAANGTVNVVIPAGSAISVAVVTVPGPVVSSSAPTGLGAATAPSLATGPVPNAPALLIAYESNWTSALPWVAPVTGFGAPVTGNSTGFTSTGYANVTDPVAGVTASMTGTVSNWGMVLRIVTPANPTITSTLPNGLSGIQYSATLTASGGQPPYTWQAVGLPAGLSLNGSVISGTPIAMLYSNVTLTCTDSVGASSSTIQQLMVRSFTSPPSSKYIADVLASSPVRYWPLDDALGSLSARELVNNSTGNIFGGVTLGSPDPWGSSGAASFDGSSGEVIDSNAWNMATYNSPYSIEFLYSTMNPLGGMVEHNLSPNTGSVPNPATASYQINYSQSVAYGAAVLVIPFTDQDNVHIKDLGSYSQFSAVTSFRVSVGAGIANEFAMFTFTTTGGAGTVTVTDTKGNTYTQLIWYATATGQRTWLFQSNSKTTLTSTDYITVTTTVAVTGWSEAFSAMGLQAAYSYYNTITGTGTGPVFNNVPIGPGMKSVIWISSNETVRELVPSGFTFANVANTGGGSSLYSSLGYYQYFDHGVSMSYSPTAFMSGGSKLSLRNYSFQKGPVTLSDSGATNDGNWHHGVLAFDGVSTMSVYRDGILQGTVSTTNSYMGARFWRIGHTMLNSANTSVWVDDQDAAITYTGTWSGSGGYDPGYGFYKNTIHFSNQTGATATFKFIGTSITLWGDLVSNSGIASISIDGGTAVMVDCYAQTQQKPSAVFMASGLANVSHTIVVTVTGNKNPASADTFISIDAFIYDTASVTDAFFSGSLSHVAIYGRAITAGEVALHYGSYTAATFINPMVPPEMVWVEILDNNLVSHGVIQYATVNAQLYFNAVGSWDILVQYTDDLWNLMMLPPANGGLGGEFIIEVNWRGIFKFGGKCEQPSYIDSIPGSTGTSAGGSLSGPFISLSGADYLGLVANRIVYPDPTKPWSGQLVNNAYAMINVKLETAIKNLVNLNLGPGAIASRKHSLLDIATDSSRGPAINYIARFSSGVDLNLLDVLRSLIAQNNTSPANPLVTNTNMGLSLRRNGKRLLFDVYIPRDLSSIAWFSEDTGNLTSIEFSLTDPTCTDALVKGSTAFAFAAASNVTQWNKIEVFVDDSSETDAKNLQAAAQDALITGAQGPQMATTVTDTPFLVYGRDYGLGDIVTIQVRNGDVYTDIVSGVTLTADASQSPIINVVPTIGNSTASTSTDKSVIGQLIHRIKLVEKKLSTK